MRGSYRSGPSGGSGSHATCLTQPAALAQSPRALGDRTAAVATSREVVRSAGDRGLVPGHAAAAARDVGTVCSHG